MAEVTMLDKLKIYFGIDSTDTSKDAVLNLIIAQDESIADALYIDSTLVFAMCVEDYSNWLKSGTGSFQVSQASDGINRYSEGLKALIKISTKCRVF